jgi:hypothetical protein
MDQYQERKGKYMNTKVFQGFIKGLIKMLEREEEEADEEKRKEQRKETIEYLKSFLEN